MKCLVVAAALVLLGVGYDVGATTTGGSNNVIHLNFLHRHGARTEPYIDGPILDWGGCVLSDTGAVMALQLGRFLNTHYGPNSSLPLFPAKYNWTQIESRSTDFERTVRTGVGVLRGIYSDQGDSCIPYLYHQSQDLDYEMGYFYSWPSAVLRLPYINTFNMDNNAQTLKIFDDNQTALNEMGKEIGTTICPTQQTLCALASEDIATCSRSNGPGAMQPVLKHYLMNDDLYITQTRSFAWQYMWDVQDRYWANTGPYGRILAQQWVKNFQRALLARGETSADVPSMPTTTSGRVLADSSDNGSGADENGADAPASTAFSPMVHHYSAHDITIYGFFVAIGVINETTTDLTILIPTFTAAVIGEITTDGLFTLKYAQCDQDHGSGFAFSFVPEEAVNMGCMDANGEKYWSNTCPLEDFARYVEIVTKPEAAVPTCYADPRDVVGTGCDQMGSPPTSKDCFDYRRNCGAQACAEGYVLNRVSMACVKLAPVAPNRRLTVGPAIAIGTSAFLIGSVAGLVFRMFRAKRKAESLLLPVKDSI